MIIVTAADHNYYSRLHSMVASVQQTNWDLLEEIMVFDIGLTPAQHQTISGAAKVSMHQVEQVNPIITQPGRARQMGQPYTITGQMTWKPVAIKQALDKYQNILWLDAGVTILKPLNKLWEHIEHTGYFFMSVCDIDWMTTIPIRIRLNLSKEILRQSGTNAAIMGISHKILDSFVLPCYKWAHDPSMFLDDGTATGGIIAARHEQTLYSILAAQAGLERMNGPDHHLYDGSIMRCTCKEDLNDQTHIYHSRADGRFTDPKYLRLK